MRNILENRYLSDLDKILRYESVLMKYGRYLRKYQANPNNYNNSINSSK